MKREPEPLTHLTIPECVVAGMLVVAILWIVVCG